MARELFIKSWCDVCLLEETRTEGVEYTFSANGGKDKVLTVCVKHEQPVVDFQALFEALAVEDPEKPAPKRRTPTTITSGGRVGCYVCATVFGDDAFSAKNADSLSVHRGQRHKISASEYRMLEAGLIEVTHKDDATRKIEVTQHEWPTGKAFKTPDWLVCPDCGDEFDPRPKGEQSAYLALTGHRVKQHQYSGAAA